MSQNAEPRQCRCCDGVMEAAQTKFTAVKENAVYVVYDVPCLKCPTCGETAFSQDTVSKLELLTSGRVTPHKSIDAWVYKWDMEVSEIKKHKVWNVNS